MIDEKTEFTPLDYSDSTLEVYFEIADKQKSVEVLNELDFINEISEVELGYTVRICIQQIPEVVRSFIKSNIAIYAIEQDRSTYKENIKKLHRTGVEYYNSSGKRIEND